MRLFVSFFLLSLLFFSCSTKNPKKTDVLVSIPPYSFFVDKLTDNELSVSCLVPEGTSPHFYDPSPSQIEKAKKAKLWIRSEEPFEQKITPALLESSFALKVVNLALELQKEGLLKTSGCSCHPEIDLHFWLSLSLAKKQATFIATALKETFPERAQQITRNLASLLEKIDQLDSSIKKKLSNEKGSSILLSHPALYYFCRDYDLIQLAIEHEGKEPLPRHVASILSSTSQSTIKVVFTQPQYSNKGALSVAQLLNTPVQEIDPYKSNFLDTIEFVANSIAP